MDIKNPNCYTVPADEDYEPESNNEVLKNLLGIKTKRDIDILERQELKRTENELIEIFIDNHRFTEEDICNMHDLWLGDLYSFTGKYRTVNMSKGNFIFAPANRIAYLMQKFESDFLSKYTPCINFNEKQLLEALAIIHPFREGNGRIARLLSDLMVAQAKKALLSYDPIDQRTNRAGFDKYIEAIHCGLDCNYEPMKEVFRKLLRTSSG